MFGKILPGLLNANIQSIANLQPVDGRLVFGPSMAILKLFDKAEPGLIQSEQNVIKVQVNLICIGTCKFGADNCHDKVAGGGHNKGWGIISLFPFSQHI
jgi:hypothetical protein